MQIPANEKHSQVHRAHRKNKMEESIAVRHLLLTSYFLMLLKLRTRKNHVILTLVEHVADIHEVKGDMQVTFL